MKKRVISCLLAGMMAVSMAACGSSEESSTGTTSGGSGESVSGSSAGSTSGSTTSSSAAAESGIEDGVLTVGFDAEYPPYGYMGEDGEYTGFDLELAQAVCDLEGWELEKKPISWDAKDMELDSGSIDCIWNGFTLSLIHI